jgi:hypothetical protein
MQNTNGTYLSLQEVHSYINIDFMCYILRATLSPPTNYGGCQIRVGAVLPRNFGPTWDFFKPAQKKLPAPPENEKNIALAFLKATWLQIPYWVHFTFKVSNPIYMCISTY